MLAALRRYMDSADICDIGCRALWNLGTPGACVCVCVCGCVCVGCRFARTLPNTRPDQIIASGQHRQKSSTFVVMRRAATVSACSVSLRPGENQALVAREGAVPVVLAVLKQHLAHAGVAKVACSTLLNLSLNGECK